MTRPTPRLLRRCAALVCLLVAGTVTTGCGSDDTSTADSRLSVVASTNVWGDIVRTIAGSDATVTSLISNPAQDPHSFEASSKTLLSISKADVVVENGGGYDDFMGRMLKTGQSGATVLDAVDISGKTAAQGAELNEHVWYDLHTVAKVTDAITAALSEKRPADAADFRARADRFKDKLAGMQQQEASLKQRLAGTPIAITEPVPLYMTTACGLRNATPAAFSEAVEEGDDMSPRVLNDTLALYSDKSVKALFYNEQTSGAVTEKVEAAAKANGIPVIPVTETLPADTTYLTWMQANLTHLKAALTTG